MQAEGCAHEAGERDARPKLCTGPAGTEPQGAAASERETSASGDQAAGHHLAAAQAH